MKYLSLFSGYGGFELGIQQAYDNRELLQSETAEILQENKSDIKIGLRNCERTHGHACGVPQNNHSHVGKNNLV